MPIVGLPTEIQIYSNYMTELRSRIKVVTQVLAGHIAEFPEFLGAEIMFLQLRKALELIAFASLAANKDAYSAAHKTFAKHWRAKAIRDEIEKLNPDFYPMALDAPKEIAQGRKHFSRPVDGFLTKEEFVSLYDLASGALHTHNPYAARDLAIQIEYTVPDWVARIQRLLTWHRVQLIEGSVWIVKIPDQGEVQTWAAAPNMTF